MRRLLGRQVFGPKMLEVVALEPLADLEGGLLEQFRGVADDQVVRRAPCGEGSQTGLACLVPNLSLFGLLLDGLPPGAGGREGQAREEQTAPPDHGWFR
jgi:hypothetical protein